jgi:molybdopterin-containing oxidoreductase family iron-sulfur binding subunit
MSRERTEQQRIELAVESATDSPTGVSDAEPWRDEFPPGAMEWTDEVSRRHFLTLMGASLALAGAAGCNIRPAPARKIVPYTVQPDEITPGVPLFFATAHPLGGFGTGILVRSNEGRPTKIEGNPDHPSSLGGTDPIAQASLLDLYDPDRSAASTHNGLPIGYEQVIQAVRKELYVLGEPKKNVRLRILTETVTSPTLASAITRLLQDFPLAKWVQHEPISRENVREGSRLAFGRVLNTVYDFTQADVILALDADFLGFGPGHVRYARDFARRRKVRIDSQDGVKPEQMNRLYAVESMPTSTGSVADHRLALPSSLIESFLRDVARELGMPEVPPSRTLPPQVQSSVRPIAEDLKQRQGRVAIVVGEHLPPTVHALAHALHVHLGAVGKTIRYTEPVEARPEPTRLSDLKTLVSEMQQKQVDVLLILSSNPAYTAPADVPFAEALRSVPFKLHLGTHQDETGVLCEWHVPEAHYLETWGDIRGHDGTVTIQQPLIAPLYGGKSAIELLADISAAPYREGYDIVRDYWRKRFTAEKRNGIFDVFWQESVRRGTVVDTVAAPVTPVLQKEWLKNAPVPPDAPLEGQFEINFRPDPLLYDGRYANNGWLQECPKPVTRMTWDNAVYMSPATAQKLGVKVDFRWTGGEHGRAEVTVVELTYRNRTVKAPAWVLPGHADGCITVHLGFGRTRAGKHVAFSPNEPNAEGKPVRGFNAYLLRTWDDPWGGRGATVKPTSQTYFLACVQGRWYTTQRDPISGLEMDRKPVRYGTLEDYRRFPQFAKIPSMAVGEWELINENVPMPKGYETHAAHGHANGHSHDHDHTHPTQEGSAHGHNGSPSHDNHHDHRLRPLTMYRPMETLAPDLRPEQRRRWAMAVDLSACTGCSACVIACVSENNIPVVGKTEVTRGRIMHWINIDRYYVGPEDKPEQLQTYFQPRMCVQCENAPCEVVCPVGATVHSSDGLNDMAYNRCVGTRYCSNNCPYKVRRFNFLTYADWSTGTLKLGRNPEVSIRSRGVMEKCTFCVQRIRYAEIVAEREGRSIRDGEIVTACQAACPSGAIVFGDLNDPDSVVSRWKKEPTNYGLLAELNTRPRLTYLAALRNPNPAMPKGA